MAKGQGRSDTQRLKLFYLLEYLMENTNEDHTVLTPDIVTHLNNRGVAIERKTVVTDIHQLQEYGIDIQYDYSTKGYHILSREFELQELQLLIDSVQSSKFITQKVAKELTDKLKKQASRYDRGTLDRRSYVVNRVRSMNNSIFYYVDDLHRAIANNLKITFKYFTYTSKKKPQYYRKGELYTASPYALLWNDGNYYLLAYEGGKMKHFRVDRMESITVLTQSREGQQAFKDLKLSERSLKVFSMYGGKEYRVSMRFANHLASVVFDRFGQDIMLMMDGEDHFIFTTDIEVSDQFYGWLCGLGRGVKVIGPSAVVEGMRAHIQKIAELYKE